MKKQPIKKITRDSIKDDLEKHNENQLHSDRLFLRGVKILLFFLTLLFITQKLRPNEIRAFTAIVAICVLACLGVTIYFFRRVYRGVYEKNLIQSDAFEVSISEVIQKSTEKKSDWRGKRHVFCYLHFAEYGKISVSNTIYNLTDTGDPFYLVVCLAEKPYVALCYSKKLFEYEEEDHT